MSWQSRKQRITQIGHVSLLAKSNKVWACVCMRSQYKANKSRITSSKKCIHTFSHISSIWFSNDFLVCASPSNSWSTWNKKQHKLPHRSTVEHTHGQCEGLALLYHYFIFTSNSRSNRMNSRCEWVFYMRFFIMAWLKNNSMKHQFASLIHSIEFSSHCGKWNKNLC